MTKPDTSDSELDEIFDTCHNTGEWITNAKTALKQWAAQEKIELLEAIKMNTWSTDKCWAELNDMLDKLKGQTDG